MEWDNTQRDIGYRIGQLRIEQNESQQALADAIGEKRESIKHWENATRHIKEEDIVKICRHYDISADWLLCLSDVQSTVPEIKKAVKTTGLTEDAVINLGEIKGYYQNEDILAVLSMICNADYPLLESLAGCVRQAIYAKQNECDRERSVSEIQQIDADHKIIEAKEFLARNGYVTLTANELIHANIDAALYNLREIITQAILNEPQHTMQIGTQPLGTL